MTKLLGKTQIAILRSTTHGRWFRPTTPSRATSCMRLYDRGLLRRDPADCHRYTATEAGQAAIIAHDDALAQKLREKVDAS